MRSTMLAGFAVAAVSSGAALAQQSGDDVITVTGSRIQQPNMISPTNVNVYNSEQIQLSGAVNVSEILRTLPAAGVSGLTSSNSNFTTTASGINTVELRELGEDRTLVLVNGRRFVSGVPGSQNVDFNSIPTDIIERVDVVTGGASAVYGSDALAGVINIILQDDFEGVKTAFQAGITEAGDDETYKATVTIGSNFADGRGNAVFSTTWERENGVYARDRDGLEYDGFYSLPGRNFFSSYSEKGNIKVPRPGQSSLSYVVDGGTVRPFQSANADGTPLDGFNRQAYRALSVPTERTQVSSIIKYDLNANHRLFAEAIYASTETRSSLEPFAMASDNVYGENAAQFVDDDNDGVVDRSTYGVSILNPFVPEALRNIVRTNADLDNDGIQDIADENLVVGFTRRMTELDQRAADNLRQTFRIVGGLEGTLKDRFNYEVSLNYGRTTQAQQYSGQVNVLNFRKSLEVEEITGSPGQYQCVDEIARAQGCLPVDIFGQGSIGAGLDETTRNNLLTWLKAPSSTNAKLEQLVVSGYISGPAFNLPAGPAMFVVGGEYRDENSESIPDALTQSGQNASNKTPISRGQFDVTEGFFELDLPLISDVAFAEAIDLKLAGRFSDYSTIGSTQAYSVDLSWIFNDNFRARGQYSRAVRAPNIGEQFGPLSQTFPRVDDPCEGVTAASTGQTATNCLADPAVAARVARDGVYTPTQPERQGVSGFTGGAQSGGFSLKEETANTVSFGVVFSPAFTSWLEPLNISIDYFDIEIQDAITTIARTDSLDGCYKLANGYDSSSDFCKNIIRFGSGPNVGALRYLNAYQQNVASIETSGIDVQASYLFDFNNIFSGSSADLGTLNASVIYGHLIKFDQTAYAGADVTDYKNTYGLSEHEAQISFVYNRGPITFAWDTNYMSKAVFSQVGQEGPVGAKAFHDLQVRYSLDQTELFFGVDNIFNTHVTLGQGAPGTYPGWDTPSDVYEPLGRAFYGGVRHTF